MNKPTLTPKAQVLSLTLRTEKGTDLVEHVSALVHAGKSWREIAFDLSDVAGVRISHESVRSWWQEWVHEGAVTDRKAVA